MRSLIALLTMIGLLIGCGPQATKNAGGEPFSGSAADGTINGGGGAGLLCGNRLEMLDLYEARKAGLTLVDAPSTSDKAAELLSRLLAHHFWNIETMPERQQAEVIEKDLIKPVLKGHPFKNLETGKTEQVRYVDSLPLSNDYGHYQVPAGCRLEQIAYFSDKNTRLSIVQSAWDRLDWLSKMVLVAHEFMYMADRRDGFEELNPNLRSFTSEMSRKFVGRLISLDPALPAESDGVPLAPHKLYRCDNTEGKDATSTHFYAFDGGNGKLSLVFNSIYGRYGLYQSRADFQAVTLNDFLDKQTVLAEVAPLVFVGANGDSGFNVKLLRNKGDDAVFELDLSERRESGAVGKSQIIRCDEYQF